MYRQRREKIPSIGLTAKKKENHTIFLNSTVFDGILLKYRCLIICNTFLKVVKYNYFLKSDLPKR